MNALRLVSVSMIVNINEELSGNICDPVRAKRVGACYGSFFIIRTRPCE